MGQLRTSSFILCQRASIYKGNEINFRSFEPYSKVPKFPAEGERFKLLYIVDYAFDKRQPDAMLALLKYLSNLSIDRGGQDFLMAMTDPEDDFLAVIKKLKPQTET